jgi:hypothetical protein
MRPFFARPSAALQKQVSAFQRLQSDSESTQKALYTVWCNWARIHMRVTPDGRWLDRQAHEHARRNRGYERTRQQAEGGLMPLTGCLVKSTDAVRLTEKRRITNPD